MKILDVTAGFATCFLFFAFCLSVAASIPLPGYLALASYEYKSTFTELFILFSAIHFILWLVLKFKEQSDD